MGRKGENIFHRKDGRWEARYVKGYDIDGKCRYGYLYGKTYQEVKNKRIQALLKVNLSQKNRRQTRILLADKIATWLKKQKISVKLSTYSYYASVVKKHILPELGQIPVDQIDEMVILTYLEHKYLNTSLKSSTLNGIIGILKQILRFCHISIEIRPPKKEKKQTVILSHKQKETLENYISLHVNDITIGILLSLYLGLRIGEVCALTWEDIDFDNHLVHINKTVIRVCNLDPSSVKKTQLLLTNAKTKNSMRFIPLGTNLLHLLKNYKINHHRHNSQFILTASEHFMDPRNYYNQFKKILRFCHLEQFNYHALRHTFATECIERGLDPKSLSEMLGHADVRITLDLYVHPNLESKKEFMDQYVSEALFLRQNFSQK